MTACIQFNNPLSDNDKQHIASFISFYRTFYLNKEENELFLQKNFIFDHGLKICSQALLSRIEHGYLAESDELYFDLLHQFHLTFSHHSLHLKKVHYLDKYLLSAFEMQNLSQILCILKCQLKLLEPHTNMFYEYEQYKIYLYLYRIFQNNELTENDKKEINHLQNHCSEEIYLIFQFVFFKNFNSCKKLSLIQDREEYQLLLKIKETYQLQHYFYGYQLTKNMQPQLKKLPPLFTYEYYYYSGLFSSYINEQESEEYFKTCLTFSSSLLFTEQHIYYKLAKNAFRNRNYVKTYSYSKKAIEYPGNLKTILPLYFRASQKLEYTFHTLETKQLLESSKKEKHDDFLDVFQVLYEMKYEHKLQFHIRNLMKQFFQHLPVQSSAEFYIHLFKYEILEYCAKFKSYKIAYEFYEYELQFHNM